MKKTKLAHAVTLLISGAALSTAAISTASAGTVSYNTFNHGRDRPHVLVSENNENNGTDGWLRTVAASGKLAPEICKSAGSYCGLAKNTGNITGLPVAWVGTDPRDAADSQNPAKFGYSGTQVLHWTAVLGANDTATVSRLDSNARYGGTQLADGSIFNYADIDSAQGAWHDNVETGWKHDTDVGLFKSTVNQTVKLSITSLLSNGDVDETPDYGFTIFEGMDTTTTTYSHHGQWHKFSPADALSVGNNENPLTEPNPLGGTNAGDASGLDVLVGDYVVGNQAIFQAEAGKIYTIYLGGFQAGDWTFTRNDYQLTITSAPVPVPGAVWLFGSALAGLVGLKRRK